MRRFGYLICLRHQDRRVRVYEPPEQDQTVSEPGLTSCSVFFVSIPRKPQQLLGESDRPNVHCTFLYRVNFWHRLLQWIL